MMYRRPGSPLFLACLLLGPACESPDGSGAGAEGKPVPAVVPAADVPVVPEAAAPDPADPTASDEAKAGDDAPAAEDLPAAAPAEVEDKTVLIVGSSLAATGFGALLEDVLDAHPHVECHRKAKSATGLARPDFFDWNATAKSAIEERAPDLVIVVIGGNDGQDLVPASKEEKRVNWNTEGWPEAYRARVDAFLELLTADEREVLWLGVPRTNTNKLEAKLEIIRGVHEAAVEANPRAHYLDLTPFVEGEGGELLKQAMVEGKNQDIRGDDGVHFTMSGCRYLADKVYPQVLATMGVPEGAEADGDDEAAPDAAAPETPSKPDPS